MYLFLPTRTVTLSSFCLNLSHADVEKWMGGFEKPPEVDVYLPRFKVDHSALLNDDLKSLGMGVAFAAGQADFSKTCRGQVWISRVIHKAVVDVDERGTVGSAVSAVEEAFCGPTTFIFDRPFLFLIRDEKTGLILFVGAVEDPRG